MRIFFYFLFGFSLNIPHLAAQVQLIDGVYLIVNSQMLTYGESQEALAALRQEITLQPLPEPSVSNY